ncbi:endonuclease domain-containing protein [Fulvimonas soli]|uniref:Very-short-patch-repair endonuclease n=1 Tax=Fulvimonas soli TaxID=155197 RepID=A0A316HYM2_9GAMM|nr:DUF559 domain-containing protein [Fulvimonas soli]PWK85788.1 very-short-patch-repair endonuclease [Fulvimonas soli]TNY25732.1 DNA methylase [Fulvimonas soli]
MQGRIKPPLPSRTRGLARGFRQAATDAELRLRLHPRAGRPGGLKFRRQHPVPPHVVVFYCEAKKLVVELDGSQHDESAGRTCTVFLESLGLKVLRYWDNDVLQQTEAVLEAILDAAGNRTLTPIPLPEGEGL